MSDLPIKASSVSAKPAADKTAGKADAAQQDAQGFGNVLARQVADTSKPTESASQSTSGSTSKQAAEQDSTAKPAGQSGDELPADIMAALLAQQNSTSLAEQQGVIPQAPIQSATGENLQAALEAQTAAGTQGKHSNAALVSAAMVPGGKVITKNTALPEPATAFPLINGANAKNKGMSDTFKASVMQELNTSAGPQALRAGSLNNDMAATLQQPGILPLVTGAASSSSNPASISTDLSQPAWGDEFSQKITWMATQRNQSAELHLNPPQLGPLDVTLKMNGDQASAIFTSPHAAVREAIEQAMPKLREMLADSGIMLGNATVSDQAARNGQDNSPHKSHGGSQSLASTGTTEDASIIESRTSPVKRHLGMVDTFA